MRAPKLVLIVEDDRVIRVLTAELLLENGVGILEAADGEEALHLLERRAVEIGAIITDITMPGTCSGIDLAQAAMARWPWISILVNSGNYSQRPPGLSQQAQFLSKPWEPEAVLDFTRRAVRSDFG